MKQKGRPPEGDYGLAFCNYLIGDVENALPFFDLFIQVFQYQIDNNFWPEHTIPYIHLASIYSTLNEKDKAIEALRKNKSCHIQVIVTLRTCPRFDNIRNEPEFREIFQQLENNFQQHHDKVDQLIIEMKKTGLITTN